MSGVSNNPKDKNTKEDISGFDQSGGPGYWDFPHEILNPLASVLGLSELLKDPEPISKKDIKKLGQMIHQEAQLLKVYLTHLMFVWDLERGERRIEPKRITLGDLLQGLKEVVTVLVKDHPFSFAVERIPDENRSVFLDNELIKLMFFHLFDFWVKEGHVTKVRLTVRNDEGKVEFLLKAFIDKDEKKPSFDGLSGWDKREKGFILSEIMELLRAETEQKKSGEIKILVPEASVTDCGITSEDDLFFDDDGTEIF
jgi:hypothetical protein